MLSGIYSKSNLDFFSPTVTICVFFSSSLFCFVSDAEILADVNKWKTDLAQYSTKYVGQTLVYLNGSFEECQFRECNLGNLICDAMVKVTGIFHLVNMS